MTKDEATALARLQWGPRGYATELIRGVWHPELGATTFHDGTVVGYEVGYRRERPRSGRVVTTIKGRSPASFEEALSEAERSMTDAQREAYARRLDSTRDRAGRRPRPTRADVESGWPFVHRAVSLTDLNRWLREAGFASVDEEEAAALGLHPRRRLSQAGRTRNVVVGLTEADVAGYWAF